MSQFAPKYPPKEKLPSLKYWQPGGLLSYTCKLVEVNPMREDHESLLGVATFYVKELVDQATGKPAKHIMYFNKFLPNGRPLQSAYTLFNQFSTLKPGQFYRFSKDPNKKNTWFITPIAFTAATPTATAPVVAPVQVLPAQPVLTQPIAASRPTAIPSLPPEQLTVEEVSAIFNGDALPTDDNAPLPQDPDAPVAQPASSYPLPTPTVTPPPQVNMEKQLADMMIMYIKQCTTLEQLAALKDKIQALPVNPTLMAEVGLNFTEKFGVLMQPKV